MSVYEYAEKITSWIEEILPPVSLLSECNDLVSKNPELRKIVMGYSALNNPIDVYEFGKGEHNILIYGFPDPSEAIGGTTILALIKSLLLKDKKLLSFNLKWIFIPCLNFDDQPNNGKTLGKMMKTLNQEVDWCLSNPREETKVLVKLAHKYKPVITIPLHDEFHCDENIPIYFPVSPKIDKNLCDELRACINNYNLDLDMSIKDEEMGYGFFEMSEKAPDFLNSTFSIFAKYGSVIEFELPDIKELERKKLCEVQISIILKILENIKFRK